MFLASAAEQQLKRYSYLSDQHSQAVTKENGKGYVPLKAQISVIMPEHVVPRFSPCSFQRAVDSTEIDRWFDNM